MAQLQNIGAGHRDYAFYRYKMPKLITKVEGRGNGAKVNIVNMVDVPKALARPPAYTTKYFGCELGAASKFDDKTGTSIVNGRHDTPTLAALLEKFITKYVQCYGCGNPETEVVITKSQLITLQCAACNCTSHVDMRDKLTTFILKNPPEQKKGWQKAGKLMREAVKKGKFGEEKVSKEKKQQKKEKEELQSSSVSQADEKETSSSEAAERIMEQLTMAASDMVMIGNGSVDGSEASPRAKIAKKASPPSKLKSLKKSHLPNKSEAGNETKAPEASEEEDSCVAEVVRDLNGGALLSCVKD